MHLRSIARALWAWLNLPVVFPLLVAVAVFVYLIERYKTFLNATVVLEYLKVLWLPASLVILALVVTILVAKNAATFSAAGVLLRQHAATRRRLEGVQMITVIGYRAALVAQLYERLSDQDRISDESRRDWATFITHFKAAYKEASEAWRIAEYGTEKSLNVIEPWVKTLTNSLDKFEAAALASLEPPKT